MSEDRNDLAFWFPKIEAAGLKAPRTIIVQTECDLAYLLDGVTPKGYARFVVDLTEAAKEIGYPCFLRTGHGSGKHSWDQTCNVHHSNDLVPHVAALVEWSALVDIMGLPTRTWAVREMIQTEPLFVCEGYGRFPVTREFRFFVRGGVLEHWQPYWPPDAVEEGRPDHPAWHEALEQAAVLSEDEAVRLHLLAYDAVRAVGGGYWSVDLLQDAEGEWWLTDMAEGDASFRYDPA